MIRARSARLRRVVAARTHAVSCARSCAATANLVVTAMPCLHHAITGMASELTRRDTRLAEKLLARPQPLRAAPRIERDGVAPIGRHQRDPSLGTSTDP